MVNYHRRVRLGGWRVLQREAGDLGNPPSLRRVG